MNFILQLSQKYWAQIQKRPDSNPLLKPSPLLYFWTVIGFLLALIPHFTELPAWIIGIVLLGLSIRSFFELRHQALPSLMFTSILAFCVLAGVSLQFHTIMGREAGMALIAGFLTTKFFEIRTYRDIAMVVYSCIFVSLCSLLVSQTFEYFIFSLLVITVLVGILLRCHSGDFPEQGIIPMLGRSIGLLILALPLSAILFFMMPRYGGKLEINLGDTSIGLTDSIKPGSVADLAQNDDPAMRVSFPDGPVPPINQMYWRALVLWDYVKGEWTVGQTFPDYNRPHAQKGSFTYHQKITLWPHYHNWLFALDCPITPAEYPGVASWSIFNSGHVLQLSQNREIINNKTEYQITSASVVEEGDFKNQGLGRDLDRAKKLPPLDTFDHRAVDLANSLKKENPVPADYVRALLRYFRINGFSYNLDPGTYDKEFLGTFLFDRKVGFCEHYASAFALLMRMQGIPCRVILGYYGASYNSLGDFYLVRQSNAHAWTEYWDENEKRWIRIDPTTAVYNSNGPLFSEIREQERESEVAFQIGSQRFVMLSASSTPNWLKKTLQEFQKRRELFESQWDQMVISYDTEAQMKLTEKLGVNRSNSWTLVFFCVAGFGLVAAVFIWYSSRSAPLHPIEKMYLQICQALTRKGFPRHPWESPTVYLHRVAPEFPHVTEALKAAGQAVALYRYAPPALWDLEEHNLKLKVSLNRITSAHALDKS